MKKFVGMAIVSSIILVSCANQNEIQYPKEDMPVSRVVMYQSGIGYVERNAVVEGNEMILRIRPDQINDILKSLTVIDRGNGRPVSISLPVDHETLTRLSQIPAQVREGGIRSLLEAFRGAHVKVRASNRSCAGRIVGVETKLKQVLVDEITEDETTLTLLTQDNVLEVFRVADIKSVELYDKSLSDGLAKSLNISLNEGDWKQLEVRIRMDSDSKRHIALSYIVAMPTWKPAYRLVLSDENSGTIQGWAIVSNVTGADWNNISFSLISGQPMSFTYDLYQPQFLTRPDLSALSAQKAEAPVVTASGVQKNYVKAAPKAETEVYGSMAKKAMNMAVANRAMDMTMADAVEKAEIAYDDAVAEETDALGGVAAAPAALPIRDDEMIQNFTQIASNSQLGSFDEYKINAALTIPDGHTALVNLLQNKMTARDTRLFKSPQVNDFNGFYKGWRETESYQTIELKNDAGVALDSGPITIYRDSAVIGEGYLSRTEKDATAYITFAKEGRLEVSVSDEVSTVTPRLSSVHNGVCRYDNETRSTRTFRFESRVPNETTALLQIPRFSQWQPVDFPENVVTNDRAYVISAAVPANGSIDVPITMTNRRARSGQLVVSRRGQVQFSESCTDAIKHAIKEGALSGDQASLFSQYISDFDILSTNRTKSEQLTARRSEIETDQRSLSQTLSGLKDIKTSNADALKRQLVERQRKNERALVDITTQLYELQVANGEIELRMQEYIKTLEYERK